MKQYLLGLVLLFPSCSLFSADATPAVAAIDAYQRENFELIEAMEEIVRGATGISEEDRGAMLAALKEQELANDEKYRLIREYLISVGEVDYAELLDRTADAYLRLADKE